MTRIAVIACIGAAFSLGLAGLSSIPAAHGQTAITPPAITPPTVTPPARVLFFATQGSSSRSRIYVMNPDGSQPQNLSQLARQVNDPAPSVRDIDPARSPDGQHIAFAALTRSGQGDVYVMAADGTHRQRLTHLNTLAACPAWSPDGKRIAFGVFDKQEQVKTSLYVIDADGSHLTRLGDGFLPAWSPDGQQMLYTVVDRPGPPLLSIMAADGTHARQLVPGSAAMGAWSPDGQRIAYVAPGADKGDPAWHVWVMNVDTSQRQQLTTLKGAMEFSPQWSADGQQIFFTREIKGQEPPTVYRMDEDGQNLTPLTPPAMSSYLSAGVLVMLQGQMDESPRNLKQLGIALYKYAKQHDGALPPLRDQQELTGELLPYLDDATVLNQAEPDTPYGWNPNLSTQVLENLRPAPNIVVAYEAVPNHRGERYVLFLDGHVARVKAPEWRSLQAASAIR
ncbi:MAG: PD40 domain-containing protein [Abitibacteriaceae bacterium]|nr:PD40 domain-containing protein [Abditibacteriaceae bacterium]MBV9865754.1 PD40 domain-containing protein [Abditibacteriaceae bacterium]